MTSLWRISGTRDGRPWTIRIRAADYFEAERKAKGRIAYGSRIESIYLDDDEPVKKPARPLRR